MGLRNDNSDDGYHWNVQSTSADNEGPSELAFFFFLRITNNL